MVIIIVRKGMFPRKVRFLCYHLVLVLSLFLLFSRWLSSPSQHIRKELGISPVPGRVFQVRPDLECDREPPFLMLLVTTRPQEVSERGAIRETWGAERRLGARRICTFFLLGHGGAYQGQIHRESQSYRDILQGDFTDTYYNLTEKVLLGLEWVHRFCPSARFVMKTDSDMFVNVFYLSQLLGGKNTTGFFSGQLMRDIRPIRNKANKWYVSEEEFAPTLYPRYCSGTGYVLSGDLAGKIWGISKSIPLLKLEDVYVGLCLTRLAVSPVPVSSRRVFFTRHVPFSVCRYRSLVTSHRVSPSQLRLYWKSLEEAEASECPLTP
ncbi:beta-1,3-galactosyltransferase 5-like [Rhincodon typus]|uniref:beta-1,3-galactosyltransferase 5-like n=1 Tax=Rhincodon typus TaxID=259920 RepID=UPI002030D8CC|nr:beta-1,3-galactosyltransferase 5-like [Rhincodon typus]